MKHKQLTYIGTSLLLSMGTVSLGEFHAASAFLVSSSLTDGKVTEDFVNRNNNNTLIMNSNSHVT